MKKYRKPRKPRDFMRFQVGQRVKLNNLSVHHAKLKNNIGVVIEAPPDNQFASEWYSYRVVPEEWIEKYKIDLDQPNQIPWHYKLYVRWAGMWPLTAYDAL